MEQPTTEGLEPQRTPVGEGTPETPEDTVTLSKTELETLKHRADVSSQNFERAKKAELRVKELEEIGIVPSEEEFARKSEVQELKDKLARSEVISAHPVLKELWSEFEEFRSNPDNSGMNLRTAAKAFLVEKNLLEPQRKGLEKPTGGPKTPPATGMTAEDVKNLRETNFKEYQRQLKKGLIHIS